MVIGKNSIEPPLIKHIEKEQSLRVDSSTIFEGDALTVLRRLESQSVRCVITSPPYWGLRSYGSGEQIGLEETLPQFLNILVAVFAEAKRVLADDGTLWLNIGDGYTSGNRGYRATDKKKPRTGDEHPPEHPGGPETKRSVGPALAPGPGPAG